MTDLVAAVADALDGAVVASAPVAGGDLGEARRIDLADGTRVFAKTYRDADEGVLATEAAGLRWLADGVRDTDDLDVAEVLAVVDGPRGADRFLALRWIDPDPDPGAVALDEEALGRGLAALHASGAPAHGGAGTLHLGPLTLPDGPAPTWATAYAGQRLAPLVARARDTGSLAPDDAAAVERVCARIDDLAGPPEPPARLHGDLWAGNVVAAVGGRPWLVDPAAHGGHREVDLAMLRLFGGPSERCFAAYAEVAPLAEGWEDRVGLWQLFPLLVHAVLFGGGYGARAGTVARRLA